MKPEDFRTEEFVSTPPFESSNLAWIGHNSEESILRVEFTSGAMYDYFKVPAMLFESICEVIEDGESVGKYFNEVVKKADFKYAKIFDPKEVEEKIREDIMSLPEPPFYGVPKGMLWFDNNQKVFLEDRIMRAVNYYIEKYGASVHQQFMVGINENDMPEEMQGEFQIHSDEENYANSIIVHVFIDSHVLPGHFLVSERVF